MNPVLANPDIKINMSLDEIIHFTKEEINSQLHGRYLGVFRKRKNITRSTNDAAACDQSVPLMGTKTGVDIYASHQSPLLTAESKRRMVQAFSNRALNSDLPKKPKELLPVEYKLLKTTQRSEKVIVPAVNHVRPPHKKLQKPRKLNKNSEKPSQGTNNNSLPDSPPPLIVAPIFQPSKMGNEAIDISFDLGGEILQSKKLCLSAAASMPHMTTLNDRFTMLSRSFQF